MMKLGLAFALSFGLSMDAFAVSLGLALASIRLEIRDILKVAGSFGLFQAGMPLAGWFMAGKFVNIIGAWDHWIAFFLLCAIGLHMIYSGFHSDDSFDKKRGRLGLVSIMALSIGTSVDAFAAGVSFIGMNIAVYHTVAVIGITTFAFSMSAMFLGKRLSKGISSKATMLGGIVLIGIGAKILLEHIWR
ncbi:manganese efflux pump MntP family protein [Thermovirga sp.]|uniref:manganese efflux pump MntP n=1 Tax=Thermovirga sp. TaxID=2699834 RepID=UPI0025D13BA1|nr:manganese efflux pump MntP family protein [Thermovirga sp.]MBO8153724.1 manganese efflux pump [Thermovirga sp.]